MGVREFMKFAFDEILSRGFGHPSGMGYLFEIPETSRAEVEPLLKDGLYRGCFVFFTEENGRRAAFVKVGAA